MWHFLIMSEYCLILGHHSFLDNNNIGSLTKLTDTFEKF